MFLPLHHTKFDVFIAAGDLVIECYRLTAFLPADERFGLSSQIKRAAVSVKLNIAEGASRKTSTERKRFYEIARSSVVELDTAFDICVGLTIQKEENLSNLATLINRCYAMLSKLTA